MDKQFFKSDIDQNFEQLADIVTYFSEINIVLQSKHYVLPETDPQFEKSMDAFQNQFEYNENVINFIELVKALKENLYFIHNYETKIKK